MNKLLVVFITCAFASIAAAQTAAPRPGPNERQRDVAITTQEGSGSSASTQKTAAQQARNVNASKQVTKLSREETTRLAKDATRLNVNPENSSGQAATANMQRQTTAASKTTSKQNTEFKTKNGKQLLEKELQQKSTP